MVFVFFILSSIIKNKFGKDAIQNSWIGYYKFEEYAEPNFWRTSQITIYEENGLYADIKVDGFQKLLHVKSKVWIHEEELLFELYDFYRDEEFSLLNRGDILIKLKKDKNTLITEWVELEPMIDINLVPGQYFEKVIK